MERYVRRTSSPRVEYEPAPVASGPDTGELVADVMLLGQVGSRTEYSYRVGKLVAETLGPGHLVQVPFGTRVLQGIVLAVNRSNPGKIKLRDIAAVLDPRPCLTNTQIELARWMAAYYACGLEAAVGAMLPGGLDRATETYYGPCALPATPVRLTPEQQALIAALQEKGVSSASALAGVRRSAGHCPRAANAGSPRSDLPHGAAGPPGGVRHGRAARHSATVRFHRQAKRPAAGHRRLRRVRRRAGAVWRPAPRSEHRSV